MKQFILLLCLLHVMIMLHAQNIQYSDTVLQFKPAKNTIFLELLGNSGNVFSINYDRILHKKNKLQIAGRMGTAYSIYELRDLEECKNSLSVLSELSLLYGKEYCFESGIGLTYITREFYFNIYDILLTTRVIGYRYQPLRRGVFFKGGIDIIFNFLRYYRGNLLYLGLRLPVAFPPISLGLGYTF